MLNTPAVKFEYTEISPPLIINEDTIFNWNSYKI